MEITDIDSWWAGKDVIDLIGELGKLSDEDINALVQCTQVGIA